MEIKENYDIDNFDIISARSLAPFFQNTTVVSYVK